jgi:tetratricopeptide (TPR) repeat protein
MDRTWRLLSAACLACSVFASAARSQDSNSLQTVYDRGLAERARGDTAAAVIDLERAHAMAPNNANVAYDLAYAYRIENRNEEACRLFELGYRLEPRSEILEDWGHALEAAHRLTEAAEKYRAAIAAESKKPEATPEQRKAMERRIWGLRRDVGEAERTAYAEATVVLRSPNVKGADGLSPETGLAGSAEGVEVGLRLPHAPMVDLYARQYSAFEGDTMKLSRVSDQGALGVRWRPFPGQLFSLAAERMIKIGDNARNAWLFVAADGWSRGTEIDPFRSQWSFTSLYGEAAYIPGDHRYSEFYATALQGWSFKLDPATTLTPHVGLWATRADNAGEVRYLVEAGPGLMLTHLLEVSPDKISDAQISLSAQYRMPISDNTAQKNALVVQLNLHL